MNWYNLVKNESSPGIEQINCLPSFSKERLIYDEHSIQSMDIFFEFSQQPEAGSHQKEYPGFSIQSSVGTAAAKEGEVKRKKIIKIIKTPLTPARKRTDAR